MGHGLDAGLAGYEHIHLPGEDEQAPDEIELCLDDRGLVFLQAGVHPVALDLHGKIQAQEDDGDGPTRRLRRTSSAAPPRSMR